MNCQGFFNEIVDFFNEIADYFNFGSARRRGGAAAAQKKPLEKSPAAKQIVMKLNAESSRLGYYLNVGTYGHCFDN